MSKLIPRHKNIRNNVKAHMISKLMFDLENTIKADPPYDRSLDVCIRFNNLSVPRDYMSSVTDDCIPCINPECQFLRFLKIFHSNLVYYMLPAYNKKMHCIICDLHERGELRRSAIKLFNDNRISYLQ